MFETFNVPGLYIAVQAVLALAASWTSKQVISSDTTVTYFDHCLLQTSENEGLSAGAQLFFKDCAASSPRFTNCVSIFQAQLRLRSDLVKCVDSCRLARSVGHSNDALCD